MIRRLFPLLLSCLVLAAPARADLLVFAAASLKEPVDQIAADFGDVTVSYGGSGMMARQVGLGAPADVVLLANPVWMDVLTEAGDVQPETVTDFASNRLVLIGPAGADAVPLTADDLADALGTGRLAIGFTASVPAGIYGKAALEALGLWDGVKGHLAEVDNVRAALALVARRQAPLGIVYQSDVRVAPGVAEVALFPEASHPPIRYLGAVTARSDTPQAAAFLDYLAGPTGQAMMAKAGFLPTVAVAD